MSETRALVVFHTQQGHTAKVAGRVAARLRAAGVHVDLAGAADAPHPGGYDGVVLADPVHFSRQSRPALQYVRRFAADLDTVPSAFVQVSLAAQSGLPEDVRELRRVARSVTDDLGWRPDDVLHVPGALPYTQYGWFRRRLMKRVVASRGGDTDTGRDHEYTDWGLVDAFADRFAARLRAASD